MDLTFSPSVRRIDLNITIFDDNIVELRELFSGQLTAVTVGPNAPNVELNPQTAQISILDENDSKLITNLILIDSVSTYYYAGISIGLTETNIPVSEDVGVREVCAQVFEGDLERNTVVTLSFNADTATGKHCKS